MEVHLNLSDVLSSFSRAIEDMERHFGTDALSDANVERSVHEWLDGADKPLPWSDPTALTADEWFFITTLYGRMNPQGQRAHIRSFFEPLFVRAGGRDIRNFRPGLPQYKGLRAPWMAARLWTMGEILRSRHMTMLDYAHWLQDLDHRASPMTRCRQSTPYDAIMLRRAGRR